MALEKDGVVFNYIADGNKNITQLIDMSSGSVANRYDYSPFGQLSLDNETVANVFKFSSEYAEKETGLIYYNYRYYNPVNGKWLSRDPIEEFGGYNLYGFIGNDVISFIDVLGLGVFIITEKDDIKINDNRPSDEEAGFKVRYIPTEKQKNDCKKCGGKIILSQVISSSGGINGRSPHVDATKAEIKTQKKTKGKGNPAPMSRSGKSIKSYYYVDSPYNSGAKTHHITVLAICVNKKDSTKWEIIDTMSFTFTSERKVKAEGGKKREKEIRRKGESEPYEGGYMKGGKKRGERGNEDTDKRIDKALEKWGNHK
ncbi:RHS repeat-associated core domain-containing protein [Lentisphaerota bacterium WC36G]|nr:RHS repeat-associated core domain-containing protein [Lentisphaerae bacterium WC36]